MKSTREIWINKIEDMIIQLASQGKEYAHLHAVMMAETDKLLAQSKELPADSKDLYEPKTVYREITSSVQHMFSEINLGDTLRVLSEGEVTAEKLRSRIILAVIQYNKINSVNHIYETHKDELGIKFKRVG